jgi:hypothetical protein
LENYVPDQGNSVQDKYQRSHPLFKNSVHSKAKKGKKEKNNGVFVLFFFVYGKHQKIIKKNINFEILFFWIE